MQAPRITPKRMKNGMPGSGLRGRGTQMGQAEGGAQTNTTAEAHAEMKELWSKYGVPHF